MYEKWPILRCQGPHSWYEYYAIPVEILYAWIDAETRPDSELNGWNKSDVARGDVSFVGGLIRRNWETAQQYRVK